MYRNERLISSSSKLDYNLFDVIPSSLQIGHLNFLIFEGVYWSWTMKYLTVFVSFLYARLRNVLWNIVGRLSVRRQHVGYTLKNALTNLHITLGDF